MHRPDETDFLAYAASLQVLELLLAYLDVTTVRNSLLVCKTWYNFLNDGENEVWRMLCCRKLAGERITSSVLSNAPTYKDKLRAFLCAWNPDDCSRNIYIKPDGFTMHRNPVAQSTDACRGKVGFDHGRHVWEITWNGPLGTVAVIGVATIEAPVICHGYAALIGSNEHSWGWNLVDNHLLHNGDAQGSYPLLNNEPKYQVRKIKPSNEEYWPKKPKICAPKLTYNEYQQVGERIRVILDCDDNTLSFERNYQFLGVAFRGLPSKKLYPAVSAVYGNTEVSMVYLGLPLDG